MTQQEIRTRLAEIETERAAALAMLRSIDYTTLKSGDPLLAAWWDAKDTYDALSTEQRQLEYKLNPDPDPTPAQLHALKVADWVMSDDYDNE